MDASHDGAYIEARELESKSRLAIPPLVRDALSWWTPKGFVLSILEDPGRVKVVSWTEAGVVQHRMTQLREALSSEPSAVDELLQLQDRYARLRVEPDGRIHLPLGILHHLGLRDGALLVFVVRYHEHVEIWGPAHREALLERAAATAVAEGLP